MKSSMLLRIGVRHEIHDVARDGDCFYNSFLRVMNSNSTVEELRELCISHMTSEEKVLAHSIDDTPLETRWADSLDILSMSRAFPDIIIAIVDEENYTINSFGEWQSESTPVVLRLLREHYQAVLLHPHDVKVLKRMIRHMNPLRLGANLANKNTGPALVAGGIFLMQLLTASFAFGGRK